MTKSEILTEIILFATNRQVMYAKGLCTEVEYKEAKKELANAIEIIIGVN